MFDIAFVCYSYYLTIVVGDGFIMIDEVETIEVYTLTL